MFLNSEFEYMQLSTTDMDRRLRASISPGEFFAVSFAFGMVTIFLWLAPDTLHYDLTNYLRTSYGDFSFYYYAYWLVPVFHLLGQFPVTLVYIAWTLASVSAVFFAVRVFGGRVSLVLSSFQMIYVLFQGQFTGILVGGLALLWWGLVHRRWYIAGIGLLLACAKYQTGLIFSLFLILYARITWTERLRVLSLTMFIGIGSLIVYPLWPLNLLETIRHNPPDASGSISLWQLMGPAALLFWLPLFFISLPKSKRLVLLVATMAFGLPYFQQADLIVLFVLPVGWLPILGNLGYLDAIWGYWALHSLAVLPIIVYIGIVFPKLPSRVSGFMVWVSGQLLFDWFARPAKPKK